MRPPPVVLAAVAVVAVVGVADVVTIAVRSGGHARHEAVAVHAPDASPSTPPAAVSITGDVLLGSAFGGRRGDWVAVAGGCRGAGAFAAITGGLAVTASDPLAHRVLATARLQAGHVVTAAGVQACALAFALPAVPYRATYAVAVTGLQDVVRAAVDLRDGILEIDATAG